VSSFNLKGEAAAKPAYAASCQSRYMPLFVKEEFGDCPVRPTIVDKSGD